MAWEDKNNFCLIYTHEYITIFLSVNINVYMNQQKFGPTGSDFRCHLCAGLTLPLAGVTQGIGRFAECQGCLPADLSVVYQERLI